MECQYTFIVVSKLSNIAKIINAVDKFHAINKALIYFENHNAKDLKVLKKLSDARQ